MDGGREGGREGDIRWCRKFLLNCLAAYIHMYVDHI